MPLSIHIFILFLHFSSFSILSEIFLGKKGKVAFIYLSQIRRKKEGLFPDTDKPLSKYFLADPLRYQSFSSGCSLFHSRGSIGRICVTANEDIAQENIGRKIPYIISSAEGKDPSTFVSFLSLCGCVCVCVSEPFPEASFDKECKKSVAS